MTKDEMVLDPDFTEEEHEEFARLEKEQPYKAEHEEKIPVPKQPEDARDGKYDRLFLILFIIAMAVFLILLLTKGGAAP